MPDPRSRMEVQPRVGCTLLGCVGRIIGRKCSAGKRPGDRIFIRLAPIAGMARNRVKNREEQKAGEKSAWPQIRYHAPEDRKHVAREWLSRCSGRQARGGRDLA